MSMMDDYEEYEDNDAFDDYEAVDDAEKSPPEESGNRTFIIVAGIMGAILVLALVCMVVYAMVWAPQNKGEQQAEAATIEAQNTSVALSSALTADANAWTETPTITPTKSPDTPVPSRTPVLAPSDTPVSGGQASGIDPTADQRTATVSALLTAQAEMELTATPVPDALPNSGFADDVGIPGLIALAAGLVIVIFLSRRLRTAS